MKTLSFIVIIISLAQLPAFNQSVISRISNSQSYFYYSNNNSVADLQHVIDQCEHGDTLYMPGGQFSINNDLIINKRLVIIGAGIHPDSTGVTGRTIFLTQNSWPVSFDSGASGSEVHGIVFSGNGSVQLENGDTRINGLSFIRCEFERLELAPNNSWEGLSSNVIIQECIINLWIEIDEADNVLITNSTLKGIYYANSNCTVQNCLLVNFDQSSNSSLSNQNILYKNNIFTRDVSTSYQITEPSTFQNNLWILKPGGTVTFLPTVSHTGEKVATNMTSVFLIAPSYTEFDIHGNYELKANTIYKTMATDGGEVGFLGGPFPFKKGLHPFNPHWQQFDLQNGSTNGGVLKNVVIKASSQTN